MRSISVMRGKSPAPASRISTLIPEHDSTARADAPIRSPHSARCPKENGAQHRCHAPFISMIVFR
jgi:hypothetical protein